MLCSFYSTKIAGQEEEQNGHMDRMLHSREIGKLNALKGRGRKEVEVAGGSC